MEKLLSLLLLLTSSLVLVTCSNPWEEIEGLLRNLPPLIGAEERVFGAVSANTIYTNIVSSSTVLKVIIINLSQLLFNTVGWTITSWFWSAIRWVNGPLEIDSSHICRGSNVAWDPDLSGALGSTALLNAEFAYTNLAVGAGTVSRQYQRAPNLYSIIPHKTVLSDKPSSC